MKTQTASIPVGHLDDQKSISNVIDDLHELHEGDGYRFSVDTWEGPTELGTGTFGARYIFVMRADEARVQLQEGDLVRGPSDTSTYKKLEDGYGTVIKNRTEAVWPGDSLSTTSSEKPLQIEGSGVYFSVQTEETDYPAPRLSMLRNLGSEPGGCASYDDAFRREALPPIPSDDEQDDRGVNRVNQHTLDMRIDRDPGPIKHYHGTVSIGPNQSMPNSEIALVLPREMYDRPVFEHEGTDRPAEGWMRLYRNPERDPSVTEIIPASPGSIVVTPATEEHVYGHCFENAFAMLVAIPGFVAPLNYVEEETE